MNAIVVYESLWGNTATIARAIAEGIGPGARALSTAAATEAEIAGADLIVAGAPVHAFSLPTERSRRNAGKTPAPDLSHPPLRSWLRALPSAPRVAAPDSAGRRSAEASSSAGARPASAFTGQTPFAAFETALRWSPSGATSAIMQGLQRAGYRPCARSQRFIVTGSAGPLRAGEVDRARAWGAEIARVMG